MMPVDSIHMIKFHTICSTILYYCKVYSLQYFSPYYKWEHCQRYPCQLEVNGWMFGRLLFACGLLIQLPCVTLHLLVDHFATGGRCQYSLTFFLCSLQVFKRKAWTVLEFSLNYSTLWKFPWQIILTSGIIIAISCWFWLRVWLRLLCTVVF